MNKRLSLIPSFETVGRTKRARRSRARSLRSGTRRRLGSESLESRTLLAGDVMHNIDLPTDVNGDSVTSPIDALYIINELNSGGARSLVEGTQPKIDGLFYDVNNDSYLSPMDALTVLNSLGAEAEDHDLVQFRLETTDLAGNPIDSIDVGGEFELRVYVQDLTGREDGGVFAAYLDIEYDENLASVNGGIEYSTTYQNAKSGNVAEPGEIDEAGAIDGLAPLGVDELLVFSVPMNADESGIITFVGNPADATPSNDVLVYGIPDGEESGIVARDRILFIPASLQIGTVASPEAVDDAYSVGQNETLIVGADTGVLTNDVNPGAGDLVADLRDMPTNGTLTLSANGSFSYVPDTDFIGTDTFTYVASLDGVVSNEATVTIQVQSTNTAPEAADDSYAVDEDATLTVTSSVLDNDTDAEGDSLTAVLIDSPTNGTLSLQEDGQFTYTPDANFNGTDSFTYVANDGQEDSGLATVTITVEAVNDAPVAADDAYSVPFGGELSVGAASGVLANDSDVEGDDLTAILVSGTSNGTLDLSSDGSFVYTPNATFAGTDTFVYMTSDGDLNSEEATVTITVSDQTQVRFRFETTNASGTPISSIGPGGTFVLDIYVQDVSDVPQDGVFAAYLDVFYDNTLVSINGAISYGESYPNQRTGDTSVVGIVDELGAFDGLSPLGSGELLLASIPMLAGSNSGTAVFTSDPADQSPIHDILLFNVDESVPPDEVEYGMTSIAIVTGEPPVAVDDAYETNEDEVLVVDADNGVLANDSDPDDDELTAVIVAGPAHGTVQLNSDGSFVYTPDANFNGTDLFTYQASDGASVSNVATVTIEVDPVEDAPVAVDDAYSLDGIGALVVGVDNGVLANDVDADGDALTAVLVDGPANGSVELAEDGSFTYTPESGFVGRDSFTYQAIANGAESNIATVTIDVGDLTPSSLLGYVYADANNNGVMESWEARIGGVQVTLRGVDLLGNTINMSTRTLADGSYGFDGVLQGNYTLTEFQPLHMVDGKDTVEGELSLRNDRFIVDLLPGVTAGSYNFGERGLRPEFIQNPLYFATRDPDSLVVVFDAAGEMLWYSNQGDWVGYESVDVEFAANRSVVDVSVFNGTGGSDSEVIPIVNNRNVTLQGDSSEGVVLRMMGSPDDFGLDPVSVDAAFGDES